MSSTDAARETDALSEVPLHCVCQPWLIAAIEDTVYRSVVKAPVIAERMGVTADILYMWARSPKDAGGKHRCLRSGRENSLMWASDNRAILEARCRELGLTTPRARRGPDDLSVEGLAYRSMTRAAQLIHDMSSAIADGDLTKEEKQKLGRTSRALREILDQFEANAASNGELHGLRTTTDHDR